MELPAERLVEDGREANLAARRDTKTRILNPSKLLSVGQFCIINGMVHTGSFPLVVHILADIHITIDEDRLAQTSFVALGIPSSFIASQLYMAQGGSKKCVDRTKLFRVRVTV